MKKWGGNRVGSYRPKKTQTGYGLGLAINLTLACMVRVRYSTTSPSVFVTYYIEYGNHIHCFSTLLGWLSEW